jgi:membrane protein implicated in regulation of membrane protease activity
MDMGTVYLIMVGGSTLVLIVMLLSGIGHHDISGVGHDFGHDLSGAGHDLQFDGHGHDVDFNGVELHGGDLSGVEGPGVFGVRLILAFIIGFGVAGFIGWVYQWTFFPHWLLGIAGGLLAYFAVYQLLKLLYRLQSNTLVSTSRMLSANGIVTSEILPDSVGEIKVIDPKTGQAHYMRAMSSTQGNGFKKGQKVTVIAVTGGLAKVQ